MLDWKSRVERLAEKLAAAGELRSEAWHRALLEVPRHELIPTFFVSGDFGPDAHWREVSRENPDTAAEWFDAVYDDETLVIALDDLPIPDELGGGVQRVWCSSSTMPSLVIRMLEDLEVADSHRVLEIGTGSGYSTALLCARLGDRNVFSVDVEPTLVELAKARLACVGYRPTLVAGDGAAGLPEHAPFDRVIATCSVPAIPPAWVGQTRPGGILLADLKGPLAGNLVKLHRTDQGAEGRFLPDWAGFMPLRPEPGAARPGSPTSELATDPTERDTALAPTVLDEQCFAFFLQTHVPGARRYAAQGETGPVTRLIAPDGSWCEVVHEPGNAGRHGVREAGRQAVWRKVETAYQLYRELDHPRWERFGVTVTLDGGQRIWLDTPTRPLCPWDA